MALTFRIKRRAAGGAAGAPATLMSAEIAYNNQDGRFYAGYGDNGSGVATSVRAFAQDNFIGNVPAGGTTGQSLVKLSNADGDWGWGTVSSGGGGTTTNAVTFNNAGAGAASGTTFDGAVARTISYNSIGALPAASPTVGSGTLTLQPSATGAASINNPHGAAPSAPNNGDEWTTTAGKFHRVNGATRTVAYVDSNITGNTSGSAATLTTGRNFSITGGGITASAVSFNGSAAVALNASVDAGHITLARMANLGTMTLIGNNTGGSAVPLALTTAQVKTMLAIAFTDISGTVTNAQIAAMDAAKLTGTIDIARLPVLPSQKTIVSSGAISALTAPQQADIGEGTTVATTDGRRWVYSGSGSKTLEASYIELADITPEWSVVANKPTFAAVATSGAYGDLTGLPTIPSGTMANQNANAVAITGGTIDNVVLDGGTF